MYSFPKWVLFLVSLGLGGVLLYFLVTHLVPVTVTVVEHNFFSPDTSHAETHEERVLDEPPNWAWDISLAVAATLLWPVIGAMVVWLWELLRTWAYKEPLLFDDDKEKTATKMILAAFWPITLAYAMVVYPSMAIIHRLF